MSRRRRRLFGVAPVFGLIDFGGDNGATADRHYTIPHADALDLDATGWSWGCFTKLSQNAGSAFQYMLSSGNLNANPSFNLLNSEASADPANRYDCNPCDATTDFVITTDGGDVALNQLRLLVAQYDGTDATLYRCDPGEAAVLLGTVEGPIGDIVAPTNWNFGRRSDGNADRYLQEHAGGLWKANRALTPAEIASVANGASPAAVLASTLAGWWAFRDGAVAIEPDLSGNDNHATRVGTWT